MKSYKEQVEIMRTHASHVKSKNSDRIKVFNWQNCDYDLVIDPVIANQAEIIAAYMEGKLIKATYRDGSSPMILPTTGHQFNFEEFKYVVLAPRKPIYLSEVDTLTLEGPAVIKVSSPTAVIIYS